jgi:hypothetical protein
VCWHLYSLMYTPACVCTPYLFWTAQIPIHLQEVFVTGAINYLFLTTKKIYSSWIKFALILSFTDSTVAI